MVAQECEDLQKQRHAVESEMQENGGTRLQCVLLRDRNLVLESSHRREIKGWETMTVRRLFRFNKKEDETWANYFTRTARTARKIWTKMKLPFLSEVVAESM